MQRRLRALERRARYPGSRRVREAASVAASTGTTVIPLTLNIDQGSWIINAGCNLVYTPTNNAQESANVSLNAYDQISGEPLDQPGPPARWIMRGTAGAGVTQPFTLFGHGHYGGPARIELRVILGASGTAHPVKIENICLQASPM